MSSLVITAIAVLKEMAEKAEELVDKTINRDLERAHYMEVRYAFVEYSAYMEQSVQRIEGRLDQLPLASRQVMSSTIMNRKLKGMREAIARNQAFFDAVIEFQDRSSPFPIVDSIHGATTRTSARQVDKVNTTLHQLMRDWSAEGTEERKQSYGAVIEELERLLPVDPHKQGTIRVLVPGAGLGRLAMEIVARGYACDGNEFSYFMLMVSNFILNGVQEEDEFSLSPFVDNQCNVFNVEDMLRTLNVPDVCPSSLLEKAGDTLNFSMTAGEWLNCYEDQEATFDAITTVFFLDTAPVAIEYIEAIARLLKDGGVWINFGPLLYHWAQSSSEETDERFHRSVELSWEEIRHVCTNYGLEIIREERRDATYNANQRGLMKTMYKCVLCSAVKRSKPSYNNDHRERNGSCQS